MSCSFVEVSSVLVDVECASSALVLSPAIADTYTARNAVLSPAIAHTGASVRHPCPCPCPCPCRAVLLSVPRCESF